MDVHSAAVSLLGAVGGKFAIFKAGSNAVEVNRAGIGRMGGLVFGECRADNFKSQVIALGAAVNIQSAAITPKGRVTGKAATINTHRGVNTVGIIAAATCTGADSTTPAVRAIVGKRIRLVRVRGAIPPQGTQCNDAALVDVIVVRSNGTAEMGAVVAGKLIGSKVCPGVTAHPHSTTAAPTAVACRGNTVSVKGAAIHIYVDIGVGVAGLPPGGDSAAKAGGGVAGKGAALYVQLGPLRSIGF